MKAYQVLEKSSQKIQIGAGINLLVLTILFEGNTLGPTSKLKLSRLLCCLIFMFLFLSSLEKEKKRQLYLMKMPCFATAVDSLLSKVQLLDVFF